MSRVSLIEQLYVKRKSALEFNYDALWAPPIRSIFTQEDINELYRIATSLRYNANIEKKYELIDSIMTARGFRRAHCGTNRVVYNFLESTAFVAKVALDKVGMTDSPAEYRNQEYFKPFCCKIFDVDPTGVIAFVERVNPITSLEEFLSVSDDIFNMMLTKIIGKYVVDDLGTEKFMNYGLRYNANGTTFGPVIIDYPYAYELDGAKLICNKLNKTPFGEISCGGEIDYDDGLNHLVCTRCGRKYEAMDLRKTGNILIMYGDDKNLGGYFMRARIVSNGKVIKDSGITSNTHITKEQYESMPVMHPNDNHENRIVSKNTKIHYKDKQTYKREYYTSLQVEQHKKMQEQGIFNPVLEDNTTTVVPVTKTTKAFNLHNDNEVAIGQCETQDQLVVKVVSKKVIDYTTNTIVDVYTSENDNSDVIPDIIENDVKTDNNITINDNNVIVDTSMQEQSTDIDEAIPNEKNVDDNNTTIVSITVEDTASYVEDQAPDEEVDIMSTTITTITESTSLSDTDKKYTYNNYGYDDEMDGVDPNGQYKPNNRQKKHGRKKKKYNKNRGFNSYNDNDMGNY